MNFRNAARELLRGELKQMLALYGSRGPKSSQYGIGVDVVFYAPFGQDFVH